MEYLKLSVPKNVATKEPVDSHFITTDQEFPMGVGANPKKGSSNPQLSCVVRKYIPK